MHIQSKVLICIRNPVMLDEFRTLLSNHGYIVVGACSSADQALRLADGLDIDISVLGWSFPDSNGIVLAQELHYKTNCSVLLIVPNDQESYAGQQIGDSDIVCLTKPVSRHMILNSMEMISHYRARVKALKEDMDRLQKSIERRSIADKAKVLLMNTMGMTEAEAWKHLQKLSMNSGKPLQEVAQKIINEMGRDK